MEKMKDSRFKNQDISHKACNYLLCKLEDLTTAGGLFVCVEVKVMPVLTCT